MNSTIIERRIIHLDLLFKLFSDYEEDTELFAHLALYLCVLVSGFLETSVQTIFQEYVGKKAAPYLVNYISKDIDNFQNAKCKKILSLAERFNPNWKDALLKQHTIDSEPFDAVDSVVNNRNQIAHGKSTGLSFKGVQSYYEEVKKFLQLLEDICYGK